MDWKRKPAADDTPADGIPILDVSALIDAHDSDNDFENEIPTVVEVRRICPGCGKDFLALDDTEQPPASHDQAWRPPKGSTVSGMCRGNAIWFWCRAAVEHAHVGTLTIMQPAGGGKMDVLFFPDRRLEERPVAVERRGPPKGKP